MTQLIDGFTDSLEAILHADPIEPELDAKGNPKSISWKMTLDNAQSGAIASAEVLGWRYEIQVLKCRVSAIKVKEVPRTPEELMKSSAVVKKEDTQFPGLRDKAIESVGGKVEKPKDEKDNPQFHQIEDLKPKNDEAKKALFSFKKSEK